MRPHDEEPKIYRIMKIFKFIAVAGVFLTALSIQETNAQVVYRKPVVRTVSPVYRRVVRPPVVIRPVAPVVVRVLPSSYLTIYVGRVPYYYVNGIYYIQPEGSEEYKAVQPPLGTMVPSLPEGAVVKEIDDKIYYEYQNVLYKKVTVDGIIKYEVINVYNN